MTYRVIPLTAAHLPAAAELFLAAYAQERTTNPLLPAAHPALRANVAQALRDASSHPGMALCDGDTLLGYMALCGEFDFKGQHTGIVREYAHACLGEGRTRGYQVLYAALGEALLARGIHLHIVCHLAHDVALQETLFQFGFGALVAEALRDLSDVPHAPEVDIVPSEDWDALLPLDSEHARYYRASPIFLLKDDSPEAVRASLDAHRRNGDTPLVYREGGTRRAAFFVGRCAGEEEGFLLRDTGTAQVLAAYASPTARGRGIGKALLQQAVAWARAEGCARLMVEYETANVWGGNFWRRHFVPYLYCSARYVDCRL
jgi:GNAT superfamily N-acetyltransferase